MLDERPAPHTSGRYPGTGSDPAAPVPPPRRSADRLAEQLSNATDLPALARATGRGGRPGHPEMPGRGRVSRLGCPRRVYWLGALMLVTLGGVALRAVALYDTPAPGADEAALVNDVVELARAGSFDVAGVGTLMAVPQFAAFCELTGGWGRASSALGAVRETSLVAWVAVALMCWLLGRRLGLGRAWALASVAVLALCPTALGASRLAIPENLAICWGLAALVLAGGRHRVGRAQFWIDLAIAGCVAGAALTAPVSLALLPAVLLLAARHGDHRRTVLLGAMCLAASVAGIVLAASIPGDVPAGAPPPPGGLLRVPQIASR